MNGIGQLSVLGFMRDLARPGLWTGATCPLSCAHHVVFVPETQEALLDGWVRGRKVIENDPSVVNIRWVVPAPFSRGTVLG